MNKTRLQQLALVFVIGAIVITTYSMIEGDADEPSLMQLVATNGLELPSQLDSDTVTPNPTVQSSAGTPSGNPPVCKTAKCPLNKPLRSSTLRMWMSI